MAPNIDWPHLATKCSVTTFFPRLQIVVSIALVGELLHQVDVSALVVENLEGGDDERTAGADVT